MPILCLRLNSRTAIGLNNVDVSGVEILVSGFRFCKIDPVARHCKTVFEEETSGFVHRVLSERLGEGCRGVE